MEKQTNGIESKYAKKLQKRRSEDNGKENPMPRPFHWDYFPGRSVPDYHPRVGDMLKPLPCEKYKTFFPPKPMKPKPVIKNYDHFKMNYYGYNA